MIGDCDRISVPANGAFTKGEPWLPGRGVAIGLVLLVTAFRAPTATGQLLDDAADPGFTIESSLAESLPNSEPLGPLRPQPGHRVGGHLGSLFAPPAGRHRGVGQPLLRESWRYRPFSAGWFVGMVQGGPLIDDWVGGNRGLFGGYRLGWDYDHYWGCEMRFSFGNVSLDDSLRARNAQQAADDEKGFAADDPFRNRFDRRRDATVGLWDVSLLYYPWGDAAWRPYLMAGLGTAGVRFIDRLSTRYDETTFAMPVAVGVKYRCNDWAALRLECADNIGFGDTLNTVHYVSLTGGVEVRFGGSRMAYWPWRPGRHYW